MKSRLFEFFTESYITSEIEYYKCIKGKAPSQLECNRFTALVWGRYAEQRWPTTEINEEGGRLVQFEGIPIVENNELNDGVVAIR